jgi:hypothetical protein
MLHRLLRALFALGALAPSSGMASAHDWFTAMTDPVTGSRCCGGSDCAEVPAQLIESGAITETADGFIIRLTLDQVHHFNKAGSRSVTGIVPWNRVQPSMTGGYALCIWRDEVKCFFAPQNS